MLKSSMAAAIPESSPYTDPLFPSSQDTKGADNAGAYLFPNI